MLKPVSLFIISHFRNRPETPRKKDIVKDKNGRVMLEQREITEQDSCPICMEDLLASKEPVTYCR